MCCVGDWCEIGEVRLDKLLRDWTRSNLQTTTHEHSHGTHCKASHGGQRAVV